MSAKSQPKDKKGKKGKKGRKKKDNVTTIIIEEKPDLPPFGISVLFATIMAMPAILQYVDGAMAFDAMILRCLAALVIAWGLVNLVYGITKSFRPETETTMDATQIDNLTGDILGENTYRIPADTGYRPASEREPVAQQAGAEE